MLKNLKTVIDIIPLIPGVRIAVSVKPAWS